MTERSRTPSAESQLTDEDLAIMAENNDPNSYSNRLDDEEVHQQLSAADAYPTPDSAGEEK